MRRALSTYLYVLGAVQLLGLNLGGFFWIAWAGGIRAAKQSSRRWVVGTHSVYLALCAWAWWKWFADPSFMDHLNVFGRRVDVSPSLVLAFILLMVVVYGLPVMWLMSEKVKQEFIEQNDGQPSSESALSDEVSS
jgi:hypothetical protein